LNEYAPVDFYDKIVQFPRGFIDVVHSEMIKIASEIKASYRLSLADSIAVATTILKNGVLVSSDHHELESVKNDRVVDLLWFR
jgi:predicted nucleic acid-binding protein